MDTFIAYYRVSTDRQGRSGLGLDAQRQSVENYLAGHGELAAEYTEIESARKEDRPELAKAQAECRRRKAKLVIAKLDRLARDVHFISGMIKSGVDFVAVDMPHANKTMLQMFAVMAEWERDQISQRTKDALAAAKRRGTRLGNPSPAAALERGRATAEARLAKHRAQVTPIIIDLWREGRSLRSIAAELERREIPTARSKKWDAKQIARLLSRAGETRQNEA